MNIGELETTVFRGDFHEWDLQRI